MFVGWDFLLAEIWGLLVLAALVGLCAGWLIWGGRRKADGQADLAPLARPETQLRDHDIPPMQGGGYTRPKVPNAAPIAQTSPPNSILTDTPASPPAPAERSARPMGLDAPRDGLPDDLTKIKGIGAKMEALCNDLGFWHYDQIAEWNDREIAWVDGNLEGFKGRVTRDGWIEQAKALAANQRPAFVRRKD